MFLQMEILTQGSTKRADLMVGENTHGTTEPHMLENSKMDLSMVKGIGLKEIKQKIALEPLIKENTSLIKSGESEDLHGLVGMSTMVNT